MIRAMIVVLAAFGLVAGASAAAPGPLDGQDIPADFSDSKLVGLQTNRTGAGDVTGLQTVVTYTEGSELDALYLAKDSTFLYVGLAGNLLEVGNAYVILIDNEFDFGQTELRTEGVDGPPFALQLGGREVLVNTNGTPGDPSDDTYSITANSGTLLPDCGDPGFTGWDYALAIDGAGGTMFAHEYILYGVQVGTANALDTCHFGDSRGRVSCDPTPDNPGDAALPIYAFRNHVAESPLADGNEVFEGGQAGFGYQRGGFDNTNTTGVTESDASLASSADTGVEIAIPLANIGDSGLFGNETINMMILTWDADEYQESSVSDVFGAVTNQALPSLTGSSCSTPQSLGLRPDLSTIASCLSVDLSTLGTVDTGAVLEGEIVASDYASGSPIMTQSCPTSAGDQAQESELLLPAQDGSELDALYADNDDEFLYLGLTGNLQGGGTSINIFIDADSNATMGDQVISDFGDFALDGTYEQWDTNGPAVFTSGADDFRVQATDWGGGYSDISPNLNAAGADLLTLDFTANPANLADTVRVVLADADGTEYFYDFAIPGVGTHSLSLPLANYTLENSPGTVVGLDLSDLNFFHIAGGFNNGDPGVALDITFDHLALDGGDDGQHAIDFDPPSAIELMAIEDFDNFSIGGTYVSWTTATFTSGPTGFTVQENTTGGFGGGYFGIAPSVDMSRGRTIEFDVTVNAPSPPNGVILVLADGDDTQLQWTWYGLVAGPQTLSANITDGGEVLPGAVPGFDASNVTFAHLQTNFGTTDITFENLAFTSVMPGPAAIVGMNGNELPNNQLDLLNNGRLIPDAAVHYDYAYGINIGHSPYLAYVDYFDLTTETLAFRGAVEPDSGNSTLVDNPGGATASNPNNMAMAFNNQNTNGVIGCAEGEPCFLEDIATVAARAEQATSGVELAIPLADLGLSAADLPRVIRLWTMVGGPSGSAADQSLPPMRNVTGEGNQVLNPGVAPVNFTSPEGGPSVRAVVEEFNFFAPTGLYGEWTDAVINSGADDFSVQDTSRGGLYFAPTNGLDATGAVNLELDVTLNAGNQTETLVVVLFDFDGTAIKYLFSDVPLTGHHVLTKDLRDIYNLENPGSVPGLDLSNIGQFNLEGTWAYMMPFDVTYHSLALVGGARNYEARAARVCLGTVAGDADCDGDNDLEDFALIQQCVGVAANPVLPMECEQIDFVKDRIIDAQDIAEFATLLDAP